MSLVKMLPAKPYLVLLAISKTSFSKLVEVDLATYEDGEMVLSEAGRSLLRKMKLQPKVMKKSIIKTQNKPTFLDELLGEL